MMKHRFEKAYLLRRLRIAAAGVCLVAFGCNSSLQEGVNDGPVAVVDGGLEKIEVFDGRDNRKIPYTCAGDTDCNDDDICTGDKCAGSTCEYTHKKIKFSPVVIETAAPAVDVSLSDGRLFVAEGEDGVEVFNLADPASPALEATIPTLGDALAVEASIHLIVSEGVIGVESFNVPAYTLLGYVEADTGTYTGLDDVRSIDIGPRYRFTSGYADGVVVSEIADNSAIIDLSTQGRAMRTASSNTAAVVADALGGAAVIGLDTPDGIAVTKQLSTTGRVTDADVRLDTAIVAEYGEGFSLLDLSDPMLPVRLVAYPSASPITTVRLIGSQTAVVGSKNGLLRLFDVSIHYTGREVTDDQGQVYPVANAAAPDVIHSWSGDGVPVRMDSLDGLIAVALTNGGAALFNTGCQE